MTRYQFSALVIFVSFTLIMATVIKDRMVEAKERAEYERRRESALSQPATSTPYFQITDPKVEFKRVVDSLSKLPNDKSRVADMNWTSPSGRQVRAKVWIPAGYDVPFLIGSQPRQYIKPDTTLNYLKSINNGSTKRTP